MSKIKIQIAAIARADGGRILSVLAVVLKNLELAEECLQEAYVSALEHWARSGPPQNTSAWLLQVARRKAIDKIRRSRTFTSKQPELEYLLQIEADAPEQDDNFEIPDERLRLIFTCCHPAIERDASVALTLRTLCGLTTEEIAKAFVVSRETMAQRLVRAQQKISKAKIPYEIPEPAMLPERIEAVLSVIYLIFNEGYASSSADYIRTSLCDEAIRLCRIVGVLLPEETEVMGLLALMLLHRSRFATRLDAKGIAVSLEDQDRKKWNQSSITEGVAILEQVLRRGRPGPYQLQAAIAAIHCEARDFASTNWKEITLIYGKLSELSENPIFELNQLVASSYANEPKEALLPLKALAAELSSYQPYHAAIADIHARMGNTRQAVTAYETAIKLSDNDAEKAFLNRRLAALISL